MSLQWHDCDNAIDWPMQLGCNVSDTVLSQPLFRLCLQINLFWRAHCGYYQATLTLPHIRKLCYDLTTAQPVG
jgi:hypothetical protein